MLNIEGTSNASAAQKPRFNEDMNEEIKKIREKSKLKISLTSFKKLSQKEILTSVAASDINSK